MAATIEVLAEQGLPGLSVENVATRAGVNKTTIYRRWPALADLVTEAVGEAQRTRIPIPDTGSLAGDLRALLQGALAFLESPTGQAMVHVALGTPSGGDVTKVHREVWAARFARLSEVIRRGVERGELSADLDARFLLELLVAPVYFRLFVARERVDDAYVERLVDLVLRAACAG